MSPSKIFLYFCLFFIAGVFLNSLIEIPWLIMPGILILGLILISVFWKYPIPEPSARYGAGKKLAVAGFCLLFLVLGIWRHQAAELIIINSELKELNDGEKSVVLIGIIAQEPDIGEKSQKLTIKIQEIKTDENVSRRIEGKVLATVNRYPEYKYGDKLKIEGKLKTPSEDIRGFNYKDYLKKDGIYYVIDFPEAELLGSDFGNPAMSILFFFKNNFKNTAQKFISPPQIGFLEALVFGDESKISAEWKEKLNLTGTRHIAAVSGMNITIISGILLNLLLALGFWRKQAFYLSLAIVALYILMIGAQPSAVRAGVMAGLFMAAQHFGRVSAASRAIVFAASSMLFLNPLLLRLDIGFQLSFLAMMGIIYLQPVLSLWLRKIPNYKFFPLKTVISTSLAAQIFTSPILLYNFGYVSLISLAANILIVPFLAPVTLLIFFSGFSAMIFQPLGSFIFPLVWLCLSYIVKVVGIFSKIPVLLRLENLSWIWLLISYSFLVFVVLKLQRFTKPNFLR